MPKTLPPIHPGAILKETLDGRGIGVNRLAHALPIPATRPGPGSA